MVTHDFDALDCAGIEVTPGVRRETCVEVPIDFPRDLAAAILAHPPNEDVNR